MKELARAARAARALHLSELSPLVVPSLSRLLFLVSGAAYHDAFIFMRGSPGRTRSNSLAVECADPVQRTAKLFESSRVRSEIRSAEVVLIAPIAARPSTAADVVLQCRRAGRNRT